MKARVHRGARRKIRRLTSTWANEYAQPETDDAQLRAEATSWARKVMHEVFDVAVERPIAQPVWTMAFAMTLIFTSVVYARSSPLNTAEAVVVWGLGSLSLVAFLGMTWVSTPGSSRKLRDELGARLVNGAVGGVQRRRAFVWPAPGPTSNANWRVFETVSVEWMRHLGDTDMQLTRQGADGGVDGVSSQFAIQAKSWRSDRVPVDQIRALHGVASHMGLRGVFFARVGYTDAALNFARQVDMPLFLADTLRGRLIAANPAASFIAKNGIHVSGETQAVSPVR